MSGIGRGFAQLFKAGRQRIGNAIDNYLLDPEAKKAIEDEVRKKFQSRITNANGFESKRATNITELQKQLDESKKNWQEAKDQWQQKYDSALADAKTQRQIDINDYNTKLQMYNNALANAKQGRQNIIDQLSQQEAIYTPTRTKYIDVNSGEVYLLNPISNQYENITQLLKNASSKQRKKLSQYMKDFDERLLDTSSGTPKVINAFDEATSKIYRGKNNIFDTYLGRVGAPKKIDLRDADNQIIKARSDLTAWKKTNKPQAWDDSIDLQSFKQNFKNKYGSIPNKYNFKGQKYTKESDLDQAYSKELTHLQNSQDHFKKHALYLTSKQNEEIAKRIQDAKDIKKAKLALGAGALAAGAAAMYGGDDTPDTSDTPDNIDNTNNTDNIDAYTGEPDPNINIENTSEGKTALNGRPLKIDTDFDPDKAAAVAALSQGAYDKGVEDGDAIRASDIVTAGGQPMEDGLFELLKAMKDPYKADAIANYIYSRHGDEPEVRRRGWRAWLDSNYGDPLRSKMNIDPSGYKGMHISGGL